MANSGVSTHPITPEDAASVSEFLHEHLDDRVSSAAWKQLILPPWKHVGPNHGFQLVTDDGVVVGAYVAIYSKRDVDGVTIDVCNLAAFCVLEAFRMHSLRLIRALLKQPNFVFTDLSPSGNVVAMNERLGFHRLDTATRLVVNLPHIHGRGLRLTSDPVALDRVLVGRDARVYRDHRDAAAAEHLLVEREGNYGYLMFRRDRRKGLQLFATPLYVGGSSECIESSWGAVRSHLLSSGLVFTLAEHRVLGFARGLGTTLANPRSKMFRGSGIQADQVDYLYSELALVEW
ncbi:hypothetical protein [Rhodoglobus aureus]|uniref:N-acetyltransferase domain-containing protein n=1 Tax=Rhodoglobus aureus TaxID=191497 RepID=A0ABN1VV30_9MICO